MRAKGAGGLGGWAFVIGIGVLFGAGRSADAYELSGGVSLGGILVGTVPRFTVSPHGGFSWSGEGGFLFGVHDVCNLVPGTGKLGFGVYNQTSASIGYLSKTFDISLGPSFSIYSLPACGPTLCGRVVGLAPGGRVETNLYFAAKYDQDSIECGKIEDAAQRKACQDKAHAEYRACEETCEQDASKSCQAKYMWCLQHGPFHPCMHEMPGTSETVCRFCRKECIRGADPSPDCLTCGF